MKAAVNEGRPTALGASSAFALKNEASASLRRAGVFEGRWHWREAMANKRKRGQATGDRTEPPSGVQFRAQRTFVWSPTGPLVLIRHGGSSAAGSGLRTAGGRGPTPSLPR